MATPSGTQFQVATDATFNTKIVDYSGAYKTSHVTASGVLTKGVPLYSRVRHSSVETGYSVWSTVKQFSINNNYKSLTILSPAFYDTALYQYFRLISDNNSYYLLGQDTSYNLRIVKINNDESGIVVWSKVYVGSILRLQFGVDAMVFDNQLILITASNGLNFIYKFIINKNTGIITDVKKMIYLNTNYSTNFTLNGGAGVNIDKTENTFYIAVSLTPKVTTINNGKNVTSLSKYDLNGNSIWHKVYYTPFYHLTLYYPNGMGDLINDGSHQTRIYLSAISGYATGNMYHLFALSKTTGEYISEYYLAAGSMNDNAFAYKFIYSDYIFVYTFAGKLHKIQISTNLIIWSIQISSPGYAMCSQLYADETGVILYTSTQIFKFNHLGELVYKKNHNVDAYWPSKQLLSNGTMTLMSCKGKLFKMGLDISNYIGVFSSNSNFNWSTNTSTTNITYGEQYTNTNNSFLDFNTTYPEYQLTLNQNILTSDSASLSAVTITDLQTSLQVYLY